MNATPSPARPEIPLREYLERVIDEKDKQYDTRARAAEIAVQAALLAQKEQVAAAFLASEKAIVKAEEAQKAYNVAHNDLSHKMDEQNKATIPRLEAMAMLKAMDDKLIAMQNNYENRLEAQRLSFEKNNEVAAKEIRDLRESRSEVTGKSVGANAIWSYFIAGSGLLIGMLGFITAIIFHFIK
jgi:hypothetical protein